MSKKLITKAAAATAVYDISEFTSITLITHGGTGNFAIGFGVDSEAASLETHTSTPAVDTITQFTVDAIVMKVTINAGGTYDLIGEIR